MNKKHSRSEIEASLQARNRKSKERQTQHVAPSFNNDDLQHKKVIGGHLSGVQRRDKPFNIAAWVAGSIVCLVLIALLWPEKQHDDDDLANKTNLYQRARVDKTNSPQESQLESESATFTRLDDIDRANTFREEEEKQLTIQTLISEAETLVKNGNYTLPKEKNAILVFKQALTLDPNNAKAKQGIAYVENRFLESGLQAIKQNKTNVAKNNLAKLEKINPESEAYYDLQQALSSWQRTAQINELLSKAEQAYQDKNLILPAKKNALHYYQKVLEMDSSNQQASEGIDNISNLFIKQANEALLAGKYDAARGYLTTAGVINPQLKTIELLTAAIDKAQSQTVNTNQAIDNTSLTESPTAGTIPSNNSLSNNPPSESKPNLVSDIKTPEKVAKEQELIDQQYLTRGLTAYYQGNYTIAKNLLKPLADKGISRAQVRIAYMHYLGRGYTKNINQADDIIRAALPAVKKFSKQGRAWAQADLGSLYEDGLVIAKDYAEAAYWYRLSAEQGYAGAQTNLGRLYARGLGVKQSRDTAIKWFKKAAAQGDIAAIRNLKALNQKK